MAFVVYSTPYHGHLAATIPRETALKLRQAQKHPEELSEAQRAYIRNVKRIYIPQTISDTPQVEWDKRYR